MAAVGVEILRCLPALRSFFAARLPGLHEHLIAPWFCFWLTLHDLGKFAESFPNFDDFIDNFSARTMDHAAGGRGLSLRSSPTDGFLDSPALVMQVTELE